MFVDEGRKDSDCDGSPARIKQLLDLGLLQTIMKEYGLQFQWYNNTSMIQLCFPVTILHTLSVKCYLSFHVQLPTIIPLHVVSELSGKIAGHFSDKSRKKAVLSRLKLCGWQLWSRARVKAALALWAHLSVSFMLDAGMTTGSAVICRCVAYIFSMMHLLAYRSAMIFKH